MPEFKGDGSPEYRAAVAALKKLPEHLRLDAAAAATTDYLKEVSEIRYGKSGRGRTSWRRLLGEKGAPGDGYLPGDDHVELLIKDGTLTYVSHPYGLTLETMREIVRKADEHGLHVEVDAGSWYYPLHTVQVVYRKR